MFINNLHVGCYGTHTTDHHAITLSEWVFRAYSCILPVVDLVDASGFLRFFMGFLDSLSGVSMRGPKGPYSGGVKTQC